MHRCAGWKKKLSSQYKGEWPLSSAKPEAERAKIIHVQETIALGHPWGNNDDQRAVGQKPSGYGAEPWTMTCIFCVNRTESTDNNWMNDCFFRTDDCISSEGGTGRLTSSSARRLFGGRKVTRYHNIGPYSFQPQSNLVKKNKNIGL